MAAANSFKKLIYRFVGITVYFATKAMAKIINHNKRRCPIYPDTEKKISFLFPSLDLSRVRIIKNATLPANWFKNSKQTEGMTLGWSIYLKESDLYNYEEIKLLVHELNHVRQIRELGEFRFAARYGEQFMEYGYYNMPLEKESYDYVSDIPFNPSFYLTNNNDVKLSVRGSYAGAFFHWLDKGIDEGRDSTEYFNSAKYLYNHEDLRKSLGAENFKAAVLHWMQIGKKEGRKGN
ncbi:MAG TPA: DUF4157 domain-containing protein [Bacteroidales bacterium]|nr:DUF4157 domain-containing protein [Bacteroidales bacterium]